MENLKNDNLNTGGSLPFRIIWLYYIATPAFILAELLFGISIRVPYFLTGLPLRCIYYSLCMACGAGCYFRPRATYVIALVESSANIVLLLTGFVLTMTGDLERLMESGGQFQQVLTIKWVISFAITCAVWTISFYYGLWTLEKKWKPRSELEAELKIAMFKKLDENQNEG